MTRGELGREGKIVDCVATRVDGDEAYRTKKNERLNTS